MSKGSVSFDLTDRSRETVISRFRRNADDFEALIAATPPDRWDGPSPCEQWDARGVVAHIVALSTTVLRGRAGVEPTVGPPAHDDPAKAFRVIRSDLEHVFEDPAKPLELISWMDAAVSFDIAQHWWDLAKATGQDATMDPDFVQSTWETLSSMTPDWWRWQRKTIRAYGPEVPVPEDAPLQDRLLGLLGRDPNWTPGRAKAKKAATKKRAATKKVPAKKTAKSAKKR